LCLINWILSDIVRALIINPERNLKHAHKFLINLRGNRNMTKITHSFKQCLLILDLDHKFPYLKKYRFNNITPIVVRNPQPDLFYL
jgi:hypothetical protein